MSEVLKVDNLKMYYATSEGNVRAVDNISFSINKGECMGLAGESGSGKTSVALTLMRVLPNNAKIFGGKIYLNDNDVYSLNDEEFRKMKWTKISMVPQASMNAFDPVFTIGYQIIESIISHSNINKNEAEERAKKLLELVGIDGKRINNYPHEFSGGMKQRAAIAMALANQPDLIILDEPTTALDVIVQAQILNLLRDLRFRLNLSMMLITHDLSLISDLCDKVAIYYAGEIIEFGDIVKVYKNTLHPYTKGLLASFPNILAKKQKLVSIPGAPPNLINLPSGCRFNPRCPYAFDRCRVEDPELKEVEPGHWVACHLYNKERIDNK